MVWFLLLMMVTACHATDSTTIANLQQDVLIFCEETDTDYAKIISSVHSFGALTVCLRIKTDLCRGHSLFSAATSYSDNAFLIFWNEDDRVIEVIVNREKVEFKGLNYDLNKWHSICVTWDSSTGVVQLWIDGHYTASKYVGGGHISDPCLILGQEQDSVCGGFSEEQSFVGEITDVHVWDKALDVCAIQHYMDYQNFCPGNAVTWRELEYYLSGSVSRGSKQICFQDYQENVHPVPFNSFPYPLDKYNADYQFTHNGYRYNQHSYHHSW